MQITMEELNVIDKLPHYCPVCAYHEWNLDGLVEMIWDYIDVLRIYTKPKVSLAQSFCQGVPKLMPVKHDCTVTIAVVMASSTTSPLLAL